MCIDNVQRPLILVLALTAALAACSGSGEKSQTQVVARVNGEEITVSQLNQVLSMADPQPGENADETDKAVLDDLISQTIGAQAARKMKLDRDPTVLQAIEAAKRRVLFDAYVQRALQAEASPAPDEVSRYFLTHPELFSKRRIYIFNQLTAMAGRESAATLTSAVAGVSKLSNLISWLEKHRIDYRLASEVKPAEQLPGEMLARLQKLKVGDLGYLSATDGIVVLEIVQIIEKPLSEQQAQPLIERYLADEKRTAVEQKLIEEMRAGAKVEYLGRFSPAVKSAHPAGPEANEPRRPAAPEPAKHPLTVAESAEKGPRVWNTSLPTGTGE